MSKTAYLATFGYVFTSVYTLHALFDRGLVGEFVDSDGAVCFALTPRGHAVAEALS